MDILQTDTFNIEDFLHMSTNWVFRLDKDHSIIFAHKNPLLEGEVDARSLIGKKIDEILPKRIYRKIKETAAQDERAGSKVYEGIYRDKRNKKNIIRVHPIFVNDQFDGNNVIIMPFFELDDGGTQDLSVRVVSLQDELDTLFEQQEMISSLATSMTRSEDIDTAIELSLASVGKMMSLDRISIFQLDMDEKEIPCKYQWQSDALPQESVSTLDLVYEFDFEFVYDFLQENYYYSVDNLLLSDDEQIRKLQRIYKIYSFFGLPITTNTQLWGFIRADALHEPRSWTLSEHHIFQVLSSMISSALERVEMSEKLHRSYVHMEEVINNYPGVIIYIDNDYSLTMIKGKALDKLNIKTEDLIGKKIYDLKDELPIDVLLSVSKTIKEGPQNFIIDVGGYSFTHNTNVIHNLAGEAVGVMGVALDITQTMELQEQLESAIQEAESANMAKTNFLSRMSHEIRTPLNAIIGMNIVAQKTDDPNRLSYFLRQTENASQHLLKIVNDVLDISKIEANKFELVETEFNFDDMLQRAIDVHQNNLDEKNITLHVDFKKVFSNNIICDETRLSQVISNLLSNAIKFTPANGRVDLVIMPISKGGNDAVLRIKVKDNGIGIDSQKQDKLFKSFEQVDEGMTRKYEGTGLGLAITKQIVSLMGGDVWVNSQLGKGSIFTFEVNIKLGEALESTYIMKDISTEDLRFLVVDDSEDVLVYFENVMDGFMLNCDTALDTTKAMELVSNLKKDNTAYDIIFVDWELADGTGEQLAQKILSVAQDKSKVVMISVSDWSDIRHHITSSNVVKFIQKPVLPSVLFNTILEISHDHLLVDMDVDRENGKDLQLWTDKNILMVEDVFINQEVVRSLLEDTNVNIDVAEDGQEGLETFEANPEKFDLILMDIQMPRMDGLEATRRIRDLSVPQAKTIPIVAMTAHAFKEDVQESLAAGMDDHIAKPINVEELFDKVDMYLHRYQREDQLHPQAEITPKEKSEDAQEKEPEEVSTDP